MAGSPDHDAALGPDVAATPERTIVDPVLQISGVVVVPISWSLFGVT